MEKTENPKNQAFLRILSRNIFKRYYQEILSEISSRNIARKHYQEIS